MEALRFSNRPSHAIMALNLFEIAKQFLSIANTNEMDLLSMGKQTVAMDRQLIQRILERCFIRTNNYL
jgi:hypothetical protein